MSTPSSCPFAAALQETDDEHSAASSQRSSSSPTFASLSYQQCPVFQPADGKKNTVTCPFKDKTKEEVRDVLLHQLPPSHMQAHSQFAKAVQEIHRLQQQQQLPPKFHIGGCPVKDFASAFDLMEQNSVASLMARLAENIHQQRESGGEEESSNTTSSAPFVPLSQSLKTGTAVSHQAAEDVHFVANFARGIIDRELYGKLVIMMYHVYQTMEILLEEHGPTHFAKCHFPRELARTPALEEDLDFWHGSLTHEMTPATRDYVDRLQQIARSDPLLLLAHSYTRYLGDLSGGKILARVARKALHIDRNAGLAFYDFERIHSAKQFKDEYRKALDELPMTAEQSQRLVGEANVAFALNMRLFEELDVMANVPGAKVRPLDEALAFADMVSPPSSEDEKCPFLQQAKAKNESTVAFGAKRCPWPFVFAHDPSQGWRDWQTWAAVGLALCWLWSTWQAQATV